MKVRRTAVRLLVAGLAGAAVYAALRWWRRRVPAGTGDLDWSSAPFPFPPEPRPKAQSGPAPSWAEPDGDGSCPAGYPIKAKMNSGIYHVPGGANYERTHPDRCYADERAAERDGLRRSKV
jgi:hypothetical protein